MRIVVTGGTGFVGRNVVHTLVGRGEDVVVLTRGFACLPSHACSECKKGGKVELVTWTPDEPGDWMRVIDGADAVIHLAGESMVYGRWSPERKDLLRSSRVRSTDLIARAIARAEKKPRVFLSASGVAYYGARACADGVTEGSPPGDDFLAALCRDWEAAAQPARDAGVRTCHARMGWVLGKRGGALARLCPAFRAFLGGPLGEGSQYLPWIHVRDVVRAFEHAVDKETLTGAFNVTAPEPITMGAFADTLAKVLHRPSAMRVPAFALRLAMGEVADFILHGQRALPGRLVDEGFDFVFPDAASALADLCVQPG